MKQVRLSSTAILIGLLAALPAGVTCGAYCTASGGCGGFEWIDSVQVGSINNAFTGCDGYADFTDISTTMEKGSSYPIVVVNGGAWSGDQCGIWVDWNHNQDFTDAGETITTSTSDYQQFTAVITPPAGAVLGDTRMRIRIMYTGELSPCGTADKGEVEDYTIDVADPPGGYCAATGGGAEYIDVVQVGAIYKLSGFSGYADYTVFSTTMERETGYSILVNNGGSAYVGDQCGIWVDWNQDEDFADAGEFFSTTNPASGEIWTFIGTITPPAGAMLGSTRMRVRLMYTGTLSPCGSDDFGEVEDYTITVVPPSSDYCEASGQCGEYIGSVQVGTINKTSDCTNYDDYTGFSTTMQRGTGYPIIVTNGGTIYEGDQCGIWVDWNQDDDFEDAGEFFSASNAGGGIFTATITPPAGATLGDTRMRIRIAFTGPLGPCGPDAFGEVEDYTINVTAAAVDYCTASGGCREHIGSVQLRTINNTSTVCTGYTDYTHISTTVEKGSSYPIIVTNGQAWSGDQCGIWVDWNQDNDFDDVYEQIPAGGGPFSFDANLSPPVAAVEGTTRMRIRIMYTGPISTCGPTAFGEVEDYTLNVVSPVATYCAASGGCGEYIGSVEVGSISNTSTTCNNYADYTHLSTEMAVAADYPITVINGGSAYAGDLCGIWIDWNKDLDFDDANEAIPMSGGPVTFTATITPPIFAATMLGDTRMRIRIRNAGTLEPCGALAFGEVEDYTITVTPIIGDFVSPIGVDFRDYAVLAGQWQLPPGEPSADIAPDGGDNIVNGFDLAALTQNWLLGLE